MSRYASMSLAENTARLPVEGPGRASGRVAFDDRGRSVWEWQTAPGVFKREVDSNELERLGGELSLVDEPADRRATGRLIYDRA